MASSDWPRLLSACLRVQMGLDSEFKLAVCCRNKASSPFFASSAELTAVCCQLGCLFPCIVSYAQVGQPGSMPSRATYSFVPLPSLEEIDGCAI